MDIKRKISEAQGLTPTEQQLGISALAMGEEIRGLSIKEFAACANVSVASVHRFCKKLGLEGFKDLKVELIRLATEAGNRRNVDINFPFDATSTPAQVMERMEGLYQTTLAGRRRCSTPRSSTTPPNLSRTPDRSTSIRARTTSTQRECSATACSPPEKARRATTASSSGAHGTRLGPRPCGHRHLLQRPCAQFKGNLADPSSRHVPVVVIGTPYCARLHPGFAAYLTVSDHESMTHRITQFASHIAVQYVLDSLYSSYFAKDYARCSGFLSARSPTPASQASVTTSVDFRTLLDERG